MNLEVAPTEGDAGQTIDRVPAVPLGPFGLSGPEDVACVAVRYQIAQKLHACTEVFAEPPPNDRFRDLSDLLMLEALIDDLARVRGACVEIFELRGKHSWPPTVTVFDGWPEQYAALAAELDGGAVIAPGSRGARRVLGGAGCIGAQVGRALDAGTKERNERSPTRVTGGAG